MTSTMVEMAHVAARVLQEECCDQYRWMAIAAVIFGFLMAFGIGANDVANAFATSVSAKSITLKQAVIIAGICEFLGAMLLGASVTSTIRKNMIDGDMYADEPDVLMYGMLCALVTASFMMAVANYLALPVSTTHTIIGAIVGFSLAAKGWKSIMWKNVGLIFVSWAAAPIITGLVAAFFFWITRRFVLRSDRPYERSVAIYPATIFLAVGLDLFMVFYKAGKNNAQIKEWGLAFMIPAAWGISAVLALIFYILLRPALERRIAAKFDKEDDDAAAAEVEHIEEGSTSKKDEIVKSERTVRINESERSERVAGSSSTPSDGSDGDAAPEDGNVSSNDEEGGDTFEAEPKKRSYRKMASKSFGESMKKLGDATINRDIEAEAMAGSSKAQEMWDQGENFDPKAEEMFSYLQVLTACLLSFAHGANDVANAIAPLSAVLAIYEAGEVTGKSEVQKWVLAVGGVGIVLGLALYGYKLIISLGYKITKVSPSRGFSIELSAATVVVVASFIGIPISTTQCKVGGTIGVGLFGGRGSLDTWFLVKIILGWACTFLGVCILTAGIFGFAYYAPSASGFA